MNRLVPVLFAAIVASSCSTSFDVGPRPADGGSDAPVQLAAKCPVAGSDFCADFEKGPVDEGWDEKVEVNGGVVTLDSTRGFESARSARCRSVSGERDPVHASLRKRFVGATALTIDFDAWITTPDWSDGPNFGFIAVENTFGIYLVISRESVEITSVVPDFTATRSPKPFPYDRWVHVSFTFDWNAGSAAAVLDGEPIVSHSFSSVDLGADPATGVEIGFRGFNPPEPGVTVTFDNVVVTRR